MSHIPYELSTLWSEYFTSPFPIASESYWEKYPVEVIRFAFSELYRKSKVYNFPTLADACRFATAVMKSHMRSRELELLPAPELRSINEGE